MTALYQGVDYAFDHPTVQSLVDSGKTFAVRYLYPYSQAPGTKNLTRAEADTLNAALLHGVVSNYEGVGGEALGGYNQGVADATAALLQHAACGGPADRPIYFSVDFNTNPTQYSVIRDYFRGVASVIGLYRTGAYGEYEIVKYLFDQGSIVWGWQTYAWSAGQYEERCQLAQDRNGQSLGGGNVDLDSAHAEDFGQWNHGGNDMLDPNDPIVQTILKALTLDINHPGTPSLGAVYQQGVSNQSDLTHANTQASIRHAVDALAAKVDDLAAQVAALQNVGAVGDVNKAIRDALNATRLTVPDATP